MKKLLVGLCLLVSGFAGAANLCGSTEKTAYDHGLPWPWGMEIKISLHDVQGVWRTTDGSCENWFLFSEQNSTGGDKIITITQYDPTACRVLAQGVGYQSNRYIYAQLVRKGGYAYNMTIRAFNESDIDQSFAKNARTRVGQATEGVVMALSLFPIGGSEESSAFQISRLQLATGLVCR